MDGRHVQYFISFAVGIAAVAAGVSLSWNAPVIPKFHNNETSINITEAQISWMAAMAAPGYMAGSLMARYASDRFGRRTAIIASALPYITGTVMLLCTSTAWLLYVIRFLWGMSTGIICSVSPVYLAEIADKEIRGKLSAANRFMQSFGYFLVMSVGPFVSYQGLSSMLLVLPVCFVIAFLFIPETPYYLLKAGKVETAKAALSKLSGNMDEKTLGEQLSSMRSDVRAEMVRSGTIKELITGKQYRKALIVIIGLRFTQLFSGSMALQQYIGRIAQETNSSVSMSTALIVNGLLKFIAGVTSSMIVDKVGRRPLLLHSYFVTGMTLSIVGIYFLIQPTSSTIYGYIPLVGIIISSVVGTIGFDTLVVFIPAEIFPINVKSVALSLANILAGLLTFVTIKMYQPMKDITGFVGVFAFYAIWSFIGVVFTYYCVPETKGKSLKEIQIELQGNIYDGASENLNKVEIKDEITEPKEFEQRA